MHTCMHTLTHAHTQTHTHAQMSTVQLQLINCNYNQLRLLRYMLLLIAGKQHKHAFFMLESVCSSNKVYLITVKHCLTSTVPGHNPTIVSSFINLWPWNEANVNHFIKMRYIKQFCNSSNILTQYLNVNKY